MVLMCYILQFWMYAPHAYIRILLFFPILLRLDGTMRESTFFPKEMTAGWHFYCPPMSWVGSSIIQFGWWQKQTLQSECSTPGEGWKWPLRSCSVLNTQKAVGSAGDAWSDSCHFLSGAASKAGDATAGYFLLFIYGISNSFLCF